VKLPEARRMLERAVARDPLNGAYLDSLGWVLFRLNDVEGAHRYLAAAAARFPDDATIQEHLGDVEARRGQKVEALAHWKKSLTLSPDEPEKIEKKIRAIEPR
jgi:tetratricopeptide (TPR) repeat protein